MRLSVEIDGFTANARQAKQWWRRDAFLAKLNAAGSVLLYSIYPGGANGNVALSVAVDDTGAAHHVPGERASITAPDA